MGDSGLVAEPGDEGSSPDTEGEDSKREEIVFEVSELTQLEITH